MRRLLYVIVNHIVLSVVAFALLAAFVWFVIWLVTNHLDSMMDRLLDQ